LYNKSKNAALRNSISKLPAFGNCVDKYVTKGLVIDAPLLCGHTKVINLYITLIIRKWNKLQFSYQPY